MSVVFNHACRYELFECNPIRLVRQSAKRRTAPTLLTPMEIKTIVDGLGLRERTLVLLAVSTGLRQSELFGLKWGDIDFAGGTMSVTRSIVYGVVGLCKTESSPKPVPMHRLVAKTLLEWRECSGYKKPDDWVFASRCRGPETMLGAGDLTQAITPAKHAAQAAVVSLVFPAKLSSAPVSDLRGERDLTTQQEEGREVTL